MLDLKGRSAFAFMTEPVGAALAKTGLSPTALSVMGLFVSGVGAVLIGFGELFIGALVGAVGVLTDAFDGPLARHAGKASNHGAFVDTMSDRFGEVMLFGGVLIAVIDNPALVVLTFGATATALLVPYVRAKAEAWGAEGRGGVMGRAERMIVLLSGVGLAGFGFNSLYVTMWVLVVLTSLTVAIRIWRTWFQLTDE